MSDPLVTVLRDPDELADRVADHFVDLAVRAIAARGTFYVALAGGSTPRAMNGRLAASPRRERLDWSKVQFFFGDERCVPPADTESNYRMTRESLFAPLTIRESQVNRIHGEDDPATAAAAYDAQLRDLLGTPPAFDAVFLGMGPDGHTASLFPGTLATIEGARIAVANYVPKLKVSRITLTPHVFEFARRITITAAGAEKAEALAAVLRGPYDPDRYPAQLIASLNAQARWFVDAAAAGRLDPPVAPE